jgi:hypothetical protein
MNAIGTWSPVDPRFLLDPFEPAGDPGDVTEPAAAAREGVEADIEGGAQSSEVGTPGPPAVGETPGSRTDPRVTSRDQSGPIGWTTKLVIKS